MKNFHEFRVWLISAAALYILVVFMVYQQHHAADTYRQHRTEYCDSLATREQKKACAEEHTNAEDYLPWFSELASWPVGITAWAIILTGYAITWQAVETRSAAKAAMAAVATAEKSLLLQDQTAKRQLRAYLSIKTAKLFLHDDGSVEPRLEIINCGQTPAFELSGAIKGQFSQYPFIDPGRPSVETPRSSGTVGAGLPFVVAGSIRQSYGKTPSDVIRALETQDFVFFVKGFYTYKDIFKEPHYIEFRLVVGGFAGVSRSSTEEGIYIHFCNDRAGNNAD